MQVYKRTPKGNVGQQVDSSFMSIVGLKNNPKETMPDIKLKTNKLFITLDYAEYIRLKEWFEPKQ